MNYKSLNDYIPRKFSGGKHSITIPITDTIKIKGPGKYGDNAGGSDFVVLVTVPAMGWDMHKITWGELFVAFDELASDTQSQTITNLENAVMRGSNISSLNWFEQSVAVLCYCEHRRYSKFASIGGGKMLPLNILVDIYEGRNTGAVAAQYMRTGIAGVKKVTYRGKAT